MAQITVSKTVGYAVISYPKFRVSKTVGYAVLHAYGDVIVSKTVGYAVLSPGSAFRAAWIRSRSAIIQPGVH